MGTLAGVLQVQVQSSSKVEECGCRVPRRLTILGYNSRVSYVVQKGVGAGVPQRIGALTGVQVQSGSKAGECGSRGASEVGHAGRYAGSERLKG
mmetsp:Transcript_19515/g.54461  ORF Transcript_19515/g.54461 Transcript_19515/m.54461 type:complete len:94 (+) Transcript_19515:1783-2064(+)